MAAAGRRICVGDDRRRLDEASADAGEVPHADKRQEGRNFINDGASDDEVLKTFMEGGTLEPVRAAVKESESSPTPSPSPSPSPSPAPVAAESAVLAASESTVVKLDLGVQFICPGRGGIRVVSGGATRRW